jgi:hypothetical protein
MLLPEYKRFKEIKILNEIGPTEGVVSAESTYTLLTPNGLSMSIYPGQRIDHRDTIKQLLAEGRKLVRERS